MASGAAGKPRIVFFLPSLLIGGAERHTVDLCQRLRDRGYSARLLVHGSARSPRLAEQPAAHDAVQLNLKGMSEAGGWLKVWRALRALRPDVVVAINQTPLIVAVMERWLRASSARIACVFHTTEMQAYEKYQEGLFRQVAPFTDLLVYVGENQRRVWEERGIRPRRTLLIRNGIELGRFQAATRQREPVRQRFGLSDDDLLLGIVASLRSEKNHVELIEALAASRQRGVRAKVLAVGGGPTRAEIEARAEALGVADALILAGEQQDVAPFVAASDVGILCSKAETFPLSAIEFLAAGVPMISAAVGGAFEIVQDGRNGLLYRSGDVAGFADAIAQMADPARRAALSKEAARSAADFSVERMVDAYAEAFDALVRR